MRFFTKTEWRLFLIFWIIFSIFATSDRWNDNSSLDLTRAIVDEHRLEIDSYANNTADINYNNGHYYSDKVPGTAFLAVPLYQMYEFFIGKIPYHNDLYTANPDWKYNLFLFLAISLISAVCASLTIVLVYRISWYFTSKHAHRNLVVIILGLGTLLLHAGNKFNSHAVSTFCVFLSFYLIFKMKKEKTDYSLLAGMAGGFAILSEYRTIIILFGLFIMVLALKKWKWVLKFIIGVMIFYSIVLLYYYSIYGSAFGSPFYKIDEFRFENDWLEQMDFVLCDRDQLWTLESIHIQPPQKFEIVTTTIKYLALRSDIGLVMRLLIDPFKGLFFYSPILLFSFIGFFFMYKQYKLECLVILSCFLLFLFHLSSSLMWWMGLSFGPRYLTHFTPFFMIPLFYIFKKFNIKLILFFVILSILINIIGLQSVHLSHDPVIKSEYYCEKIDSFTPLANPLFNNYIPSFLNSFKTQQGFLVLEKLLSIRIVPFANMALLLISLLLIWKNRFIFKD